MRAFFARDSQLPLRALWAAVTLLVLVLFAAGAPAAFHHLHTVCGTAPCLNWQLSHAAMRQLHRGDLSLDLYAGYLVAIDLASAVVWVGTAAALVWSAPRNRAALIAALFLVLFRAATFGGIIATLGQTEAGWDVPVKVVELLGQAAIIPFFYVFPDGRFVPRWTRWLALAGILAQVPGFLMFTGAWRGTAEANPILLLTTIIAYAGLPAAQVYRYRRVSGPIERQQTKWVVLGITFAVVWVLGIFLLSPPATSHHQTALSNLAGDTAWYLALLPVPLTIGISVLRYRLWDVDPIINRTLVYGALTGCVVGLYVLVVGGLGKLLQVQGNFLLSLLGAGLVAVLFQPLRERLQRGVNHLLYGARDEPYRVISQLGRRLEGALAPEAALPTIVETVAQALKLPYVAIALWNTGEDQVAWGSGEPHEPTLTLPLVYGAEQVGRLVLSPRPGETSFSAADRRLLEDLARQAGVVAYAVRLTRDLQQSRQRLVAAREEERRRLRRDLHDGLGPALASMTLQADAARDWLNSDPEQTGALLVDLAEQLQAATDEIRRIVYDLRPPALDDLGLIPALRSHLTHLDQGSVRVTMEAPEALPPLPAAVEVALYRIAQEALTNVVRHAGAQSCHVSLCCDERANTVGLCVEDDGRGLPETLRAGVGLTSLRERVAELGGTAVIEASRRGGTRVRAILPVGLEEG